MTISEAIQKAIEGGYKDPVLFSEPLVLHRKFGVETATRMTRAYIFSQPGFWIALGKGLGWGKLEMSKTCLCLGKCEEDIWLWQLKWHNFVDYLIEGKTAEDFFKSLS